jgi:hypothetical protein
LARASSERPFSFFRQFAADGGERLSTEKTHQHDATIPFVQLVHRCIEHVAYSSFRLALRLHDNSAAAKASLDPAFL